MRCLGLNALLVLRHQELVRALLLSTQRRLLIHAVLVQAPVRACLKSIRGVRDRTDMFLESNSSAHEQLLQCGIVIIQIYRRYGRHQLPQFKPPNQSPLLHRQFEYCQFGLATCSDCLQHQGAIGTSRCTRGIEASIAGTPNISPELCLRPYRRWFYR